MARVPRDRDDDSSNGRQDSPPAGNSSGGSGGEGWSMEKRLRRERADAREQEVIGALSSQNGSIESILASLGIKNEQHQGKALYNQFTGLYPAYGNSVNPGHKYDWQSGKKWDPLLVNTGDASATKHTDEEGRNFTRGGWVPIEKSEWDGYQKAQGQRDRFGEGNFNPWRIERMENDIRAGHYGRDSMGRVYENRGNGMTQYYDDRGQAVGNAVSTSGIPGMGGGGGGITGQPPPGGVGGTTPMNMDHLARSERGNGPVDRWYGGSGNNQAMNSPGQPMGQPQQRMSQQPPQQQTQPSAIDPITNRPNPNGTGGIRPPQSAAAPMQPIPPTRLAPEEGNFQSEYMTPKGPRPGGNIGANPPPRFMGPPEQEGQQRRYRDPIFGNMR